MHAHWLANGSACDTFSACDPYVKLFVDGNEVKATEVRENTNVFHAGIVYVTAKMHKWTERMIKIQVWDSDNVFSGDDDLIQEEDGDVESFLEQPMRFGARNGDKQNVIETALFWQDERRTEWKP